MKEPETPYPPSEWEYKQEFDEKLLYQTTLIHDECDEDTVVECIFDQRGEKDENTDYDTFEKALNIESWEYDNDFSISSIMEHVPKYANLDNIFVRVHRDREIQHIQVQVVQQTPTDKKKLKEAYDMAYAGYLKKKEKYDLDMKAYKEWKKKEDIKECTKRLEKLKSEND